MSSTAVPESVSVPWSRKLRAWLPTLFWLAVLAFFSSDTFSAEHTGSILRKILHTLFGPISHHRFEQIHFLIRKAAHFSSYGLLSAFAFFSWRGMEASGERWRFRWCGLALLLTLNAASLDEFHQTFVSSRTGNIRDVLLDMTGAIFFQFVIALWLNRKPAA